MGVTDSVGNARVAVLSGVSGSGKTRAARELEAQGWTRLSADAIVWENIGEGYLTLTPEQQREAYMNAGAEMLTRLSALLREGRRVVLDSSMCRRSKRDAVRAICREARAECALFYLTAPREVLLQRLSRRHGTGPDDQIVPVADLDRFLNGFEVPDPDENATLISATDIL